jgi:hypothetical protein
VQRPTLAAILILLLMTRSFIIDAHPGAPPQKPSEYEVKAAYLLNFVRFVQWPATSPGDRAIYICVLGRDPFGDALERVIGGEEIGGKTVLIRRIAKVQEAESCRVLFIDSSQTSQLAGTLDVLRGAPVLTVSDIPQFILRGGIVQFVLKDNRVRFEINLKNAERVGLVLSSQLLNVAASVLRDR